MSIRDVGVDDLRPLILDAEKPAVVDARPARRDPHNAIAPIFEELAHEHGGQVRMVQSDTESSVSTVRATPHPTWSSFQIRQQINALVDTRSKTVFAAKFEELLT